ncbi:signal peptidase I [Christensenellaceae bacterium]|nr:signal peptidase I [Christensenellaceae bacterium]BDF61805.1 signal peptidase I [Christensenellaceae bacterium]
MMEKAVQQEKKKKSDKRFWIVLLLVIAALICLRVFVLDWIWISGESMLPTLQDGELVLTEKISKNTGGLSHGDLVIVIYPDGLQCVKRIIGMEGDTISIQDNMVIVNGDAIDEPYLNEKNFPDMTTIKVPENSIFVMGDNRNHSSDSREPMIGPIPDDKIVGRAISVIYPFDRIRGVK